MSRPCLLKVTLDSRPADIEGIGKPLKQIAAAAMAQSPSHRQRLAPGGRHVVQHGQRFHQRISGLHRLIEDNRYTYCVRPF
jgi:hypothetical protein